MEYIGSTGNDFKERYNGHNFSFSKEYKRTATKLSEHIWELKDKKAKYEIEWSILRRSHTRKPSAGGLCSTCNLERMAIAEADRNKILNKRSELSTKCKHFKRLYFQRNVLYRHRLAFVISACYFLLVACCLTPRKSHFLFVSFLARFTFLLYTFTAPCNCRFSFSAFFDVTNSLFLPPDVACS